MLPAEKDEKSILFHLTEDSIWDNNRILTEKLHMSNFKIAMAIILDHFWLKNGNFFFISHRNTTQENDFFYMHTHIRPTHPGTTFAL